MRNLIITIMLVLAGCNNKTPFNSIDITGAQYAREFSLTDHTGKRRSLVDYRGKVVAVFFGFVQCPDVCPTTLQDLAEVKKQLGPNGEKLQVLFVTVDPERDTQEVLGKYVPNFDPSFAGLYGTAEETAKVTKEFKIIWEKVPGPTPTSYTINHSTGTYIIDRNGQVRLFVKHGAGADALVADIKRLL